MLDTKALGQPVELGQISRALTNLWEAEAGAKSRASLVNFVLYGEGTDALEANNLIIFEFTRAHACRAILMANVPGSTERRVQAWINAHCHFSRAGGKQICCEQITFIVEETAYELLGNVLLANLDSDLPLYLWWQPELPATPPTQLWHWVDRLIFDSQVWQDTAEQARRLRHTLKCHSPRLVPCDLNWTRSLHLRQATAQMFDNPEALRLLPGIDRLVCTHAPGHLSTVRLHACWIAGQLGWTAVSATSFRTVSGAVVQCEYREAPGAPIGGCLIAGPEGHVDLQRDAGSAFIRAEVRGADGRVSQHLLPAGADDQVGLLNEELTRGGRHRVYLKALEIVEGM